jgi:hypothetical protein
MAAPTILVLAAGRGERFRAAGDTNCRRRYPAKACWNTPLPPQPMPIELRERMSGNICRCGAYSNIVDVLTEVAGRSA